MEKETRSSIERATQKARRLLELEYAEQLVGSFGIMQDGRTDEEPSSKLDPKQQLQRKVILADLTHKRLSGMTPVQAVKDTLRDFAFTTLNRFVALKMMERGGIVQECVSKGDASAGFIEYASFAAGLRSSDDGGYRLYIECIFDELSTEIKALFDRNDPSGVLWPRKTALEHLLALINHDDLQGAWAQEETIGWVYQYFNTEDERSEMRESHAPRNSRELAIRNQFFTPKYVVDFLVQNTLVSLWNEMKSGNTPLSEMPYLIRRDISKPRPLKDPRDIRIVDPACGSAHFLLTCFEVLALIYVEAWQDPSSPPFSATQRTLRKDYATRESLHLAIPSLILRHNVYGIDIDPRCAQIAALALWMRAQRTWQTFSINRSDRPLVEKTNVIVAEPIPASDDVLESFVTSLELPLQAVARSLCEKLKRAGEAGSLLDVSTWIKTAVKTSFGGAGGLFKESDEDRWHKAESSLLDRLQMFAKEAREEGSWAKGLFAADALRGLGFVEAMREPFDVVLMNPPFGDPPPSAREACGAELAIAANDIGGAFILAAKRRWAPNGCIGVLSSTTLWFKPSVADWRRSALLRDDHKVRVAAHLGGDVLDGATVSASALVIDRMEEGESATFVRLVLEQDKATRLASAVKAKNSNEIDGLVYEVAPANLEAYRGSPLAYWISDRLRSRLASLPRLEGNGAEVRQGVATADDFRFVLAWWEVPQNEIGLGKVWAPYAKSSEFSPYWDDITWVIRWKAGGREVRAFDRAYPRSTSYFGKPGVTYPARSVLGFNPRAFPEETAFSNMGSVAFPIGVEASALLGYLGSRPLEYVLSFTNGSLQGKKGSYPNHYEVGQIKDLPWPSWQPQNLAVVTESGEDMARRAVELQSSEETAFHFRGRPGLSQQASVEILLLSELNRRGFLVAEIQRIRKLVDNAVASELGFSDADIEEMDREFLLCEVPTTGAWRPLRDENLTSLLQVEAEKLASELFGLAIGQFDIRIPLGTIVVPSQGSAFDPLPQGAPAVLSAIPAEYPVPVPDDGILTSDIGSDRDVGQAVSRVLDALWSKAAPDMEADLAKLVGFADLRSFYLSNSVGGFSQRHRRMYSKSRRTAPIYWSIAGGSGRYSIFLRYAALSKDTIHRVLTDHVSPKMTLALRSLEEVRSQANKSYSNQARDLMDLQETVDDLKRFEEELLLVAPLWDPAAKDGVLINHSLLWRLTGHQSAWQKELKSVWDKLCAGSYDWSHLAFRLWPERVIQKCTLDRSLAIAHGLEDNFWLEGGDGKWTPRKSPPVSAETILGEQSFAAVKAGLRSLLEAPDVSAPKRARRSKTA